MDERMVEELLETEDYYKCRETPLKTASQLRNEHRLEIIEVLELKEFTQRMELGVQQITEHLPEMISAHEWNQVRREFTNIQKRGEEAAQKFLESDEISHAHVIPQELLGISNQSLKQIYQLGKKLTDEKDFEHALGIFHILTYLNPLVYEYWIGLGVALFYSSQVQEAQECFNIAKILKPDKAISFIYSAFCLCELKDKGQLKEEFKKIERVFLNSEEEKKQWEPIYDSLKNK